jgi:hypothetical protein
LQTLPAEIRLAIFDHLLVSVTGALIFKHRNISASRPVCSMSERGMWGERFGIEPFLDIFFSVPVKSSSQPDMHLVNTDMNPQILRVCRQFHSEGASSLYGRNTFRFASSDMMIGLLRNIGLVNMSLVQHIQTDPSSFTPITWLTKHFKNRRIMWWFLEGATLRVER